MRTSAINAQEAAEAAKQAAASAEGAAASARNAVQSATETSARLFRISVAGALAVTLAAIGILITLVMSLHSYFSQIESNVQTTQSLAANVMTSADQAKSDAARGIADGLTLKHEVDGTRAQIDDLRSQLGIVMRQLETLRGSTSTPAPSSKKVIRHSIRRGP